VPAEKAFLIGKAFFIFYSNGAVASLHIRKAPLSQIIGERGRHCSLIKD
jgi:hypothetical protein